MIQEKKPALIVLSLLIVFGIIFYPRPPLAQGSGPVSLSGYAWSSNIGWINMGNDTGQGYGVTMESADGPLSGYAWSSNIGWVDFGSVARTGDRLTGFARALSASGSSGWDGNIKLDGINYGVMISTGNPNLTGFAWGGDVVGWVDFRGVFIGLPDTPDTGTCTDGIQNGNESGVDIGGRCGGGGGDGGEDGGGDGEGVPPGEHVPLPGEPGYIAPSISVVSGHDRLEINTQPLTSPAISSPSQFTAVRGSTPGLRVKIRNIRSFGDSSIEKVGDSLLRCRLDDSPLTNYIDSEFKSCDTASLTLINQFDTDVYLNIRVESASQSIKERSPYQVLVGIDSCLEATCSDSALFDYRVGPVNPI
ncbi:hypothetical protein IT398_02360 [Candidatus Nomurabacteria bacterium]|nr:hypothetical protein [Candidatus Nomurabacteria bacterium]